MKRSKKYKFWRIWAGFAVPILMIAGFLLVLLQHMTLTFFYTMAADRAREAAWEYVYLAREPVKWQEWLRSLEVQDMVGILYGVDGTEIACSDLSDYAESKGIKREDYEALMKLVQEMPRPYGTAGQQAVYGKKLDWYGVSTFYGRLPFSFQGEEYVLQYGMACAPWPEHKGECYMAGCMVLGGVLLFTLLLALHFNRIYQARVRMEAYYREHSIQMAHQLKTPLMAISGYAENLKENTHSEKHAYYAEAIMKNASQMGEIIADISGL